MSRINDLESALKTFADMFDGDLENVGGCTTIAPQMTMQPFKVAKELLSETAVSRAMKTIKQAMIDDDPSQRGSYAHSWHCNIAMACYDAIEHDRVMHAGGVIDSSIAGNDAASRFMKICFDVETNQ